MKISLYITFIVLLTFCFSCKKKKTDTEQAPASQSQNNALTPTPSTLKNLYDLETFYSYNNNGITTTKDSSFRADFYNNCIYNGAVTLNGKQLFNHECYQDYPPVYTQPNVSVLNWSITGGTNVSVMTQTLTANYPIYTGAAFLPDTCIKANGLVLNITGISNCNQNIAAIKLIAAYPYTNNIYKNFNISNGSVSFSASEIASYLVNQSYYITFKLKNTYTGNNNGEKSGFSNSLIYSKKIYFK